MAIVQSDWGKGYKAAPVPAAAGIVVTERFTFKITSNLAVNDIIELGILPAYSTVTDLILISDEVGTATFDVGLMSGTVGSTDGARTSGNQFIAGAADASTVRMSAATGFRLAASDTDRSIGVKVLTAGITASGQVIDLLVSYRQ